MPARGRRCPLALSGGPAPNGSTERGGYRNRFPGRRRRLELLREPASATMFHVKQSYLISPSQDFVIGPAMPSATRPFAA